MSQPESKIIGRLFIVTSILVPSLVSVPAFAQGNIVSVRDEIVVTAQRREQNIRDVPVAIDVIGGDAVQFEGLEDVQRIAEELPSLVVGGQAQTFGGLNLSVRGVGSQVGDPAVGFYIDELYQANSSGFVTQFLDVERIEVLKGPQGTLWGRNNTGGTFHYVTKRPELGGFGAEAFAEIGWYDSLDFGDVPIRKFGAAVNLPVTDQLAARISIASVDQDNYTFNLERGEPEPNQDAVTVRGDILFEPNEDWSFLLGVSYINDPAHNSFLFKNRPFEGSGAAFVIDLLDDVEVEPDNFRVRSNVDPVADFEEIGFRFETTWDISDRWTVRSITGFKALELDREIDLDVTQVTLVHNNSQQQHRWWSEELQVLYEGERLNFIGGFYYFGENLDQRSQTISQNSLFFAANCNTQNTGSSLFAAFCPLINGIPGVFPGVLGLAPLFAGGSLSSADFLPGGAWDMAVAASGLAGFGLESSNEAFPITITERVFETTSIAVFGQGSYDLTDTLTATVGLRWTRDSKDIDSFLSVVGLVPDSLVLDDSFSALTPKFSLEWRPTDNTLAYASVTRGFKSGTLNLFAGNLVGGESPNVSEETVWAYEVGFKGGFLDNRILVDGAVFYYDYSDYQLSVQFAEGLRTFNLSEVEIKGAEAAVQFSATDAFDIGASASYVDAQVASDVFAIDPFDLTAGLQNLNGSTLPRVPEWKASAYAQYKFDLGNIGAVVSRVSINYSGAFANDPFGTFPGADYTTVNANARYVSPSGRWWINVFGRNLTNEEYTTSSLFGDGFGEVQFFAPPRTVGVQAGFKY